MKRIIYILLLGFLVASCATNKVNKSVRSLQERYDSLVFAYMMQSKTIEANSEKKTVVIDTVHRSKLPVENSANVLPVQQRSDLKTSLARSAAWVDSVGMLHHSLANLDSANLPARKELVRESNNRKAETITDSKSGTNVSDKSDNKQLTTETIYVHTDRFAEGFFYWCGWLLWVGVIVAAVIWLQRSTSVKPITWIWNIISKLLKLK